jgi:hypothetical protein
MPFTTFMDELERKEKDPAEGVLYCQHQNSSLTSDDEFASLCEDVPELSWATNAFNASPDAVNMWIGEDRSITTLHHDPYENLLAVVVGTKRFLLYPPSDYHWLDKREYPKAKWQYDQPTVAPDAAASTAVAAGATPAPSTDASASSRFSLIPDPDGARTAWFNLEPQGPEGCIAHDSASSVASATPSPPLRVSPDATMPLPAPGPFPSYSTHPPMSPQLRAEFTTPMEVEVHAGEVLYVPALWFHRVAQQGDEEGKTIAVNFWCGCSTHAHHLTWTRLLSWCPHLRVLVSSRLVSVSPVLVSGMTCRMTVVIRPFVSSSKYRTNRAMHRRADQQVHDQLVASCGESTRSVHYALDTSIRSRSSSLPPTIASFSSTPTPDPSRGQSDHSGSEMSRSSSYSAHSLSCPHAPFRSALDAASLTN